MLQRFFQDLVLEGFLSQKTLQLPRLGMHALTFEARTTGSSADQAPLLGG